MLDASLLCWHYVQRFTLSIMLKVCWHNRRRPTQNFNRIWVASMQYEKIKMFISLKHCNLMLCNAWVLTLIILTMRLVVLRLILHQNGSLVPSPFLQVFSAPSKVVSCRANSTNTIWWHNPIFLGPEVRLANHIQGVA